MKRPSTNGFLAVVDRWIFDTFPASATDLAAYRILYAALGLLMMPPYATWLGSAPLAFFSPPLSLAALFDNFPPAWVGVALNILLAAFLWMLLAGWHTRTASLGTGLTFLVLKSFEYSIGKINHDILLALPPLVLAFSNWGDALSYDSRRQPSGNPDAREGQWPLTLLALLIAIAMFTAGWAKLASGWLDPKTYSTYGQLMANYWAVGRDTPVATLALKLGPSPLWELADWAATLIELVFVVTMFHARLWKITLAVACLFHVGVWLLFDIVFETNLVAYAAFVSYGSLATRSSFGEKLAHAAQKFRGRVPGAVYPWVGFALSLVAITMSEPLFTLLRLPLGEFVMIAGTLAAVVYFVHLSTARRQRVSATEDGRKIP